MTMPLKLELVGLTLEISTDCGTHHRYAINGTAKQIIDSRNIRMAITMHANIYLAERREGERMNVPQLKVDVSPTDESFVGPLDK